MYQIPLSRSRNQKNRKFNVELWLAILVNIAALWIAYNNLQYNKLQVYQSGRVATQLKTLNQSNFIVEVNNKLREEKNDAK